jgi:hypothetical protein
MSERAPHVVWLERLGMRAARPEELALARVLFFGWVALCNWRRDSALWLPFAELEYRPPGLAGALGLGFAGAAWMQALDLLWVGLLLASALGTFTRWAAAASGLLGAYLFALPHGIGRIEHGDAIMPFMMAAFALSRAGDAWSIDEWLARRARPGHVRPPASVEYEWPLRFAVVCVVAIYFAAGIAKLRATGLEWAWQEGGRLRLISRAYTHAPPTQLGLLLAEARPAHQIMGCCALALEVLSPLALLHRWARAIIVPGLLLLQLGIWLLMGVLFDEFFVLFAICIPWLPAWDWARRLLTVRVASSAGG